MPKNKKKKMKKREKESLKYASKAIKKSEELQGFLSLLEYKRGKKNKYSSVNSIFKKLKIST